MYKEGVEQTLFRYHTGHSLSFTFPLYPSQSVTPSHSAIFPTALSFSVSLPKCLLPCFPIITSHLGQALQRQASHLSPRFDNRYRCHSLSGRSPINTCSELTLFFPSSFPSHSFPSLLHSFVFLSLDIVAPPILFCHLCTFPSLSAIFLCIKSITGHPYAIQPLCST